MSFTLKQSSNDSDAFHILTPYRNGQKIEWASVQVDFLHELKLSDEVVERLQSGEEVKFDMVPA